MRNRRAVRYDYAGRGGAVLSSCWPKRLAGRLPQRFRRRFAARARDIQISIISTLAGPTNSHQCERLRPKGCLLVSYRPLASKSGVCAARPFPRIQPANQTAYDVYVWLRRARRPRRQPKSAPKRRSPARPKSRAARARPRERGRARAALVVAAKPRHGWRDGGGARGAPRVANEAIGIAARPAKRFGPAARPLAARRLFARCAVRCAADDGLADLGHVRPLPAHILSRRAFTGDD